MAGLVLVTGMAFVHCTEGGMIFGPFVDAAGNELFVLLLEILPHASTC
jgi:hypothetical protein